MPRHAAMLMTADIAWTVVRAGPEALLAADIFVTTGERTGDVGGVCQIRSQEDVWAAAPAETLAGQATGVAGEGHGAEACFRWVRGVSLYMAAGWVVWRAGRVGAVGLVVVGLVVVGLAVTSASGHGWLNWGRLVVHMGHDPACTMT